MFLEGIGVCGKVHDTKRHSNRKTKADYRRMKKYIKSLERSKFEAARRQNVLDLWLGDHKIKEIALELGVSVRTVNRIMEKLQSTIKRRNQRLRREFADGERVEILKILNGLSSVEQADWIKRFFERQKHLKRRRRCHKLLVTIDADLVSNGRSGLILKPKYPALVSPYVINFRLVMQGKKLFLEV